MIKGLTHGTDGVLNSVTKYKGKISTGYAPNEGPNRHNYPTACGFFRMLKEVTETVRVSGENHVKKAWKLNESIQTALCKTINSDTPRKLDLTCLFRTPRELWESSLAMYSSTDGLVCKSSGEGTIAKKLEFNDKGERVWTEREFEGIKACPYKDCPDFKAKKCMPIGLMKVFPDVDLSTNPYRFETRSINTILGIESDLDKMWNLAGAAHAIKCKEAKKDLRFEGFFGAKMSLIHRKIKSGGREVYISEIRPSDEFAASLMMPIQRGIAANQKAALTAGSQHVALLGQDQAVDIDSPQIEMDVEDEKAIATQFNADAAKQTDGTVDEAAKALLEK